jgi:hypothetical protein
MKFIITSFCLCLLVYQPCQAQYPSQEEHNWVGKRFFPVLEQLFPIEERQGFSLGYRSYRDLHTEELEYSFVFNRIVKEKYLTVVLRTADSVSLYDQIMILHRKDKNATIDAIKSQLKIKEWRLSEETCPAIRRQYDEFYRFSLQTLSAKDRAEQAKGEFTIILHPRVHTFKADISGGSMELVLSDFEHPFVQWTERTKHALEACATKQKKR